METSLKTNQWVETITIRRMQKSDLPALEWDGEYTRFREVYLLEFERSQIGSSVLWVAEKPFDGIIGQLFVQLMPNVRNWPMDIPELTCMPFAFVHLFAERGWEPE